MQMESRRLARPRFGCNARDASVTGRLRTPSRTEGAPCGLQGAPSNCPSNQLPGASLHLQLACLLAAAAPVILENEAHPVALVERLDVGGLEGCDVNEHVLAPVLGFDEAEAFGCV